MFFPGVGDQGNSRLYFRAVFCDACHLYCERLFIHEWVFFLFHLLELKVPHVPSPNMPLGRNPVSCPPPPPLSAFPLTAPTGLQRPVSSRSWAARFRYRSRDVADVGSTRTFRSGFRAAQARQLGAIGGQYKEGERGGLVHPCWQRQGERQGESAAFPGSRRRGAARNRHGKGWGAHVVMLMMIEWIMGQRRVPLYYNARRRFVNPMTTF